MVNDFFGRFRAVGTTDYKYISTQHSEIGIFAKTICRKYQDGPTRSDN
jgi:hypothetical protein